MTIKLISHVFILQIRHIQIMMRGEGVEGSLPGFAGSQGYGDKKIILHILNFVCGKSFFFSPGRNWREQRNFFVGQLRRNSRHKMSFVKASFYSEMQKIGEN